MWSLRKIPLQKRLLLHAGKKLTINNNLKSLLRVMKDEERIM